MTKPSKPKKPSRAALDQRILEFEGQLAFMYHAADHDLHKAGSVLMASGVLIQLTALGGRELIKPIVIRDGLSDKTIESLREDIRRSFALATAFKPKGMP